jgi:ABC-2 type transport system ATP-binding protein
MNMNGIINCDRVAFKYGENYALRDFTFKVNSGEVVALLGPNGAGKTTSVRVMNGLLPVESGSVQVFGLNAGSNGTKIRKRTGVLTETPALYERLTAMQNLTFFGTLAGLSREEVEKHSRHMLDIFGLAGRADDRVDTFSKGMKQRLAIARAMLHDPEMLFLDEPTSDLDPEAAKQVGDTILEITGRNSRTVILCTHRLAEAERLCDRVAIMSKGYVMAFGTLDELRHEVCPSISVVFRISSPFAADDIEWLKNQRGINSVDIAHDNELVLGMPDEDPIPAMLDHFIKLGAQIHAVEPRKASLEEIYLHLQHNGRKEKK